MNKKLKELEEKINALTDFFEIKYHYPTYDSGDALNVFPKEVQISQYMEKFNQRIKILEDYLDIEIRYESDKAGYYYYVKKDKKGETK